MKMKNWLNARCAQLLTDINNTPLTDNCDEIKMKLIMAAMRESSVEMFHRAAENSRKEIEKINAQVLMANIQDVEALLLDPEETTSEKPQTKEAETSVEDKPEPRIKLSSSLIRRVDSF